LYDARERLALELAERMTYTRRQVTDAFFARLRKRFSDEELVELAAVIALENFRSKFNPVFGVESGESCALPWVREAAGQAAQRLH
jgi:alkylhydroperoxidase family enzyme